MKKLCLAFVLLSWINSQAQINLYDSLYFGSRWRTYMIHLPTGYDVSVKYPLLLAFHGAGGDYAQISNQSGLSQKSDTEGFIVVYPEGIKASGLRTWNGGLCCGPAVAQNINDVGFVNNLLDTLFAARSIDTTKVYTTGFSNGAVLCYRLASQLSVRIAAIAPVAGALAYSPWAPSRPVPIISFHSYADNIMKYAGGNGYTAQNVFLKTIGTSYTCTILRDTVFSVPSVYDQYVYKDCSCNVEMEQYVSYDGGHSWAGGASTGDPVTQHFNATDLMWEFFQKYTTACEEVSTTGIKENTRSSPGLSVLPNPVNEMLQLQLPAKRKFNVRISDISGKTIKELDQNFGKLEMNCKDLPPGLYFITAENAEEVLTGKFIRE